MHLEGDGEVKQEGELVVDDDQITVRDKETAALSPMDQSNGEQKQSGEQTWHPLIRRQVKMTAADVVQGCVKSKFGGFSKADP